MNPKLATFLKAVVPILVALASIFVIAGYAASPEFHAATIASLDEKTGTVLELTAASTAASAAITLLPGDTATPIADKLAELSSYFLIVISAIYLEKYLTTITGDAAFVILIPAACLLLSVNAVARRHQLRRIAWKLIVFALAVALVIPASVRVSDIIDETYASSIHTTINAAIQTTEEISVEEAAEEMQEAETAGGLKGFFTGVKDTVSNTGDHIKRILNNFINALAVMLVTSCLIPILVMVFFVWIAKILMNSEVDFLPPRRESGREEMADGSKA